MIKLYLDDLRPCPPGFLITRTKNGCMDVLENNKVDILSLDHDLGLGMAGTGYDVAMFIVEQGLKTPEIWPREIYLHTDNPVGRQNMYQLLTHYCPEGVRIFIHPYGG